VQWWDDEYLKYHPGRKCWLSNVVQPQLCLEVIQHVIKNFSEAEKTIGLMDRGQKNNTSNVDIG